MDTLSAAVVVSEVTRADLGEWVSLALRLWPDEEGNPEKARVEMEAELLGILQSPRDTGFLVRDRAGRP